MIPKSRTPCISGSLATVKTTVRMVLMTKSLVLYPVSLDTTKNNARFRQTRNLRVFVHGMPEGQGGHDPKTVKLCVAGMVMVVVAAADDDGDDDDDDNDDDDDDDDGGGGGGGWWWWWEWW